MRLGKYLILLVLSMTLTGSTLADNLYRVMIASNMDADILSQSDIKPVHRLNDSYLVLAEEITAEQLSAIGLTIELLESEIGLDEIFISRPGPKDKALPGMTILEIGTDRIIRTDPQTLSGQQLGLIAPLGRGKTRIYFEQHTGLNYDALAGGVDLFDLIGQVNADSLKSYLDTLVSYDRLTGTATNWQASQWLKTKYESFGYDSVRFDEFIGSQLGHYGPCDSRNVIAVKPGSRYPDYQLVIGAHMDVVPNCPGADDDASGTAGVLEIARILANVETDLTLVFCAFDAEESWMVGSYHYMDDAEARGDNIIFMLNLDMIGYYKNTDTAKLYHGPLDIPSRMFSFLADSLVGLSAKLMKRVSASDHLPFHEAGIPVTFVMEDFFSEYYHTPGEDITTLDVDYIARVVQASLATTYTIAHATLPVTTLAVFDVGDGQSLQVHWQQDGPSDIESYKIVAADTLTMQRYSVLIPGDETSGIISGLPTGRGYLVRVLAVDSVGLESFTYNEFPAAPRLYPLLPDDQAAVPIVPGVRLTWSASNTELDFDHYAVIRDGSLIAHVGLSQAFDDMDPALGSAMHDYLVVAVDTDGNLSDTVGANWMSTKAATLQANRILAVNRSGTPREMCDSAITRVFLEEALIGLNFDYFADPTLFITPAVIDLIRMVDYEVVIIAAESGKGIDDLGSILGLYEQLRDYLELGGKVIIFGRWGNVSVSPNYFSTITYDRFPDYLVNEYFHLSGRTLLNTQMQFPEYTLKGDLVGGHTLYPEYPALSWDSVLTAAHGFGFPFTEERGIPCPSLPHLDEEIVDIIYTYDSWNDSSLTEGQPVAWRYLGADHQYVCFDLPLSFMERGMANYALRQALSDLGLDLLDDHDNDAVPNDSDNCRFVANPLQTDSDGDGVGDACDACEGYDDLSDADADGVPDGCDQCANFNDKLDNDGDGYADSCDNCPLIPNADQTDIDGDGMGDACDGCCGEFTAGQTGNTNCDNDGHRNLADITRLIDRIYLAKTELCCEDNGNVNGDVDDRINLADITRLIDHVYISKTETAPCE